MAWNAQKDYGRSGGGQRGGGGGDRSNYDYPNSGALFPTQGKRSDQSPDFYGSLQINDDVLDYIIREAEQNGSVSVELSGWSRVTRNNQSITSIKVNIPYAVRQAEEGNQSFRRPGYPNRGQQQNGRPAPRQGPQQRERASQYNEYSDERRRPGERQPQPNQRSGYAEQSGGNPPRMTRPEQRRQDDQRRTNEFSRGDRMPDFMRDDDPNGPPF